MNIHYEGDKRTGRLRVLNLKADTAADELFLTRMNEVLSGGIDGNKLVAVYAGGEEQLTWIPIGAKKDKDNG